MQALQGFLITFNQTNIIFLYIFKQAIIFIALSRVYFTFGGFNGPEKDQILKLVNELVSFKLFLLESVALTACPLALWSLFSHE